MEGGPFVMTMIEHRRMEKFPIQLPASLSPVGEEDREAMELLTSDVCSGGAFFHTDQPMPLGTEVKLELVLPLNELKKVQGERALVKVSGAVIRVTETGMAICFDEAFKISPLQEGD